MANKKISAAADIGTLATTDKFPLSRVGGTTALYGTPAEINTFIRGAYSVDVAQKGADPTGVADSTTAIQAAIAALPAANGVLYFQPGTYLISDTIDARNLMYANIQGNQAVLTTKTGTNFTNKPLINLCGAEYTRVYDLHLNSTVTSNIPAVGVLLGRTATSGGGFNYFLGCHWRGHYSLGTLYNVGQECVSFESCNIYNTEIAPAIFDSSVDLDGLTGYTGVSNTRKFWHACTIANGAEATPNGVVVRLHNVTQELAFRDCYFFFGTSGTVFSLTGANSHYNLIIDNARAETNYTTSATSRFMKLAAGVNMIGATLRNINFDMTSDAVLEVAGNLTNSTLDLRNNIPPYILVDNGGYLTYSTVNFDLPACVSIATTGRWSRNVLIGGNSTGVNPVTGAGAATDEGEGANTNIVLNAGGYAATQPNKSGWATLTGGDTSPSVLGKQVFDVENGSPTSITTFDDGVPGQTIILRFSNTNTTLVNSGGLILAGSTNYVSVANGTMTLYYDGRWGVWHELSRMTP
jgi:hypothetical protein